MVQNKLAVLDSLLYDVGRMDAKTPANPEHNRPGLRAEDLALFANLLRRIGAAESLGHVELTSATSATADRPTASLIPYVVMSVL